MEFRGGLYLLQDEAEPCMPTWNVRKCLTEGARLSKRGREIERGLQVLDIAVPLLYEGPRTVDELWADQNNRFVYRKLCRVKASLVVRTRPCFPQWTLELIGIMEEQITNLQTLRVAANDAGAWRIVTGEPILRLIALRSGLSLTFGTHPMAMKRSDPRNALQPRTQTPDDFIPDLCRG